MNKVMNANVGNYVIELHQKAGKYAVVVMDRLDPQWPECVRWFDHMADAIVCMESTDRFFEERLHFAKYA